jgi:hypothetical protein
MKQTAVDWLVQELSKKGDYGLSFYLEHKDEIIQAKEMEKEQIVKAYIADSVLRLSTKAEQYYNETFKSNESNDYTRFTNEGK